MIKTPPHSEVLEQIALLCLESDSRGRKFDYSDDDLLNASIVFNSILGTKLFDLMQKEGHPFDLQMQQAQKMGEELRLLIYTFTNIDMHEIAKK